MSAIQPSPFFNSQQESIIPFISSISTEAIDSDSSQTHGTSPASLETIFGLRLTLSKTETDEQPSYRVSLVKSASDEGPEGSSDEGPEGSNDKGPEGSNDKGPEGSNTLQEIQGVGTQIQATGEYGHPIEKSNLPTKRLRPYSLFPDYGQGCLWRDDWNDPEADDDYEVDDEDIDSRYPSFYPSFERWREVFFKSFEAQECHLGADSPVFPDVRAQVGWTVEGLLLGCWLALQEDVQSVRYRPWNIEYLLVKDPEINAGLQGFDSLMRRFLGDMQELLDARLHPPQDPALEEVDSD